MTTDTLWQAAQDIASVLPARSNDLARLRTLAHDEAPTVTVIGKYNHGKSRLLNELIGADVFAVADRRETVQLAQHIRDDVRWLDAPGLDADVSAMDDRHAWQAAWLESDIRLFVHSAREGELDAAELSLLGELRDDARRTRRETWFVLTQTDQVADESTLQTITAAIGAQVSGLELQRVSAARYRKGRDEGKQLLVDRSGLPALRLALQAQLAAVPQARAYETAVLTAEIREELIQLQRAQEVQLKALRDQQCHQRQRFDAGLHAVIRKVSEDILAMLADHPGNDALVPDSAKDVYGSTAGKRERNRLQTGYSRACIELDSFLAGHGVNELPAAQQTGSGSINSVMIAVLGVSVKLHRQLRTMFGESSGRERMQQEFTHYYERSADRCALDANILEFQRALAATLTALASLSAFDVNACV